METKLALHLALMVTAADSMVVELSVVVLPDHSPSVLTSSCEHFEHVGVEVGGRLSCQHSTSTQHVEGTGHR